MLWRWREPVGLEADDQQRLRAVEPCGPVGLGGVEHAEVRRPQLRLHDVTHRFRCRVPRGEGDAGRGPELGSALDAHPRLADDAEDPLAADHHAVGRRARAAAGKRRDSHQPARREHAHRLDEVVDVRVVGRVVATGARRDPAAERREAERLREVSQRVAMRAELVLEVRAEHTRLDARGARHVVDLEHLVEAVERDRDDAVGIGRVHAPHDRRPAAERHDDVSVAAAPIEGGLELGLGRRVSDDVGRVRELEVERARAIGEVRAVRVEGPLPRVGRAPRRESVGHPDAGRPERERRRASARDGRRSTCPPARRAWRRARRAAAASVPRSRGTTPRTNGVSDTTSAMADVYRLAKDGGAGASPTSRRAGTATRDELDDELRDSVHLIRDPRRHEARHHDPERVAGDQTCAPLSSPEERERHRRDQCDDDREQLGRHEPVCEQRGSGERSEEPQGDPDLHREAAVRHACAV